MKKILKLMVFTIFVLSITVLTLGSCDFDISGILGEYVCVHEWSEWDIVEQGDCKTPGLIQRECLNCGAIDKETTALKEHTEGVWVVDKEATCIEDGSKHTECTVCGTIISTKIILAIKEHEYENYNCIYCGLTSKECFEFTYIQETDSYSIKAKSKGNLPNEISLPDSFNGKAITSIGDWAFFNYNSLTNVEIPDSITSIGNSAFSDCDSLTSIEIPDSVTSIGSWAFSDCPSLASVVIPNSITSISRRTFFNCSNITSIYIPDSVTSICDEAFLGCSSLTSVVIGNSVTSIGKYAFNFCVNLTHVYYNGTLEEWEYIDVYLDSNTFIMIGNSSEFSNFSLTNATRYYYRENRPTTSGRFWHWGENGEVVVWE